METSKTIQFYYFTELTIGTWSVRTLLDKGKAGLADRRTEIIATELAKYKIGITALSLKNKTSQGRLCRKRNRMFILLEWLQ